MDEVKSGEFITPKEVVFTLKKQTHNRIHREIKDQKKDQDYSDIDNDFELEIFGINFKFNNE
jgi:hypothetical protein